MHSYEIDNQLKTIVKNNTANSSGFTLIELMITVAIVAILSAIAYPSYEEYVRRGRRSELQVQVLQSAQFMERYFTTNGTYVAAALPTGLTTSPENATATARYYDIGITNVTANSFTVTGTRTSGRGMDSDKCGDFIITQTAAKTLANNTAAITECWRR
jgi:type IV pilus assembly protein PilE